MEKPNREEWLMLFLDELRPHFVDAGYPLPKEIRVTCGFPSRSGAARKNRAVGEVHTKEASEGKTFEVFISPTVSDTLKVSAILAHELSHIAVGLKVGHRGEFVKCIRAMQLEGKPTHTVGGDAFKAMVSFYIKALGEYPHETLHVNPAAKKQTTRMILCLCPGCGYRARVSRAWIDMKRAGPPLCPNQHCGCFGTAMVAETKE